MNEVATHPQMIANINTFAGTDLVFKLARHYLNIGSRNLHTSVKASLVVSISDGTPKAHVGSNRAVVWTLVAWVTIIRPAKGLLGELGKGLDQSVFLLDTIPGFLASDGRVVPDFSSKVSEICVAWDELFEVFVLPLECLTHDDDVVTSSEGVFEDSDRF